LFFIEFIKNNIATRDKPRSDKKGPDINNAGIKIIIQEGIKLKRNNSFFIFFNI
tara:strand:+ start:198 stop:359 length:162 start_codon:yes stop_codon:yes gene_type:complete